MLYQVLPPSFSRMFTQTAPHFINYVRHYLDTKGMPLDVIINIIIIKMPSQQCEQVAPAS